MNEDQAYDIAFLITGSHIDAELARTRQRQLLVVCPICGDGFEKGDTVDLYQGCNAHRDCVEAGAEISYADCDLW
jgi:hypothetical protein